MLHSRLKHILGKIHHKFVEPTITDQQIPCYWYNGDPNFGDLLSPLIINHFLHKEVIWVLPKYFNGEHLMAVGSVLQYATKDTIVWGSGFMSEDRNCKKRPKKILAVRGPKSRKKLIDKNIECPEIYGDPALLLPEIYNPTILPEYELGIIPHYIERNDKLVQNFENIPGVKIVDIQNSNPFDFINELLKCRHIASSSLHGIIAADAYGIPSTWIKFSNNVVGDGFKFQDYFLSVNKIQKPLIMTDHISIDHILNTINPTKISIDLDLLKNSLINHFESKG